MKYYLHDTTAFSDEKVTLLYMKFGFEAVGLFYVILEKLALQEKPVPEIVLKSQLVIKKRLQNQLDYMYKIGILSIKNAEVFSETLLNFSEKYQIKKEKTRKRVSQWRDRQKDNNNVTCYERVRNAPKVKESKVKVHKENIYTDEIKNFTAQLVKLFPESIIKKLTTKTKLNWVDTVNKLINLDQHSKTDILKAVEFGRNDKFWSNNFLSINKLRKKDKNDIKYIDLFLYKSNNNGDSNLPNVSGPVRGVEIKN